MKKSLLLIILLYFSSTYAQPPGQWVWVHGDNTYNSGNYGVIGVTSPTNKPPGLYEATEWKDLNGNFWVFGGGGYANYSYGVLWKYEPAINQWTWMKGDTNIHAVGSYGTQGVPAPTNTPPARVFGGVSWTDLQGNLWLYGGYRVTSGGGFSDLWKYDISTNEWTWMQGTTAYNVAPVYGTQGVPSPTNTPGARREIATGWVDSAGDLWLFGGQNGLGTAARNDLWRYNIASNMWTWMKGSQVAMDPGHYGTLGVEDTANVPPGRWSYSHWKDLNGNFWLFGGAAGAARSDMWRYNPLTNNWTWMYGDSTASDSGNVMGVCITTMENRPAARTENRSCATDDYGNFWMYGGSSRADLWKYCPASNQWTLHNGNMSPIPPNWGFINVPSPGNQPGGRQGGFLWYREGQLYLFGGQVVLTGAGNDMWKYTINNECGSFCQSISVNVPTHEKIKPGIKVYPNPTDNSFTVESAEPLKNIALYTTEGKLLKSIVDNQSSIINIDMSEFSSGIYFLHCETERGKEIVKVVKY
jgi:hypothetical protein